MGMDALTASAFTALARTQLPDLHRKLAALAKLPVSKREADSEIAQAVSAVQASFFRLNEWINGQCVGTTPDHLIQNEIKLDHSQAELTKSAEDEYESKAATNKAHLDSLTTLAAELVFDRTRFTSIEEDIRSILPRNIANTLTEAIQQLDQHTKQMRDTVMKIRMVPLRHAFSRLPALVRELGAQLGKDIEIQFIGESTALDKTMVEQIEDPLVRLIQNSCRQGIETPDTRHKVGKPSPGLIKISARQEGNYILIVIKDDGQPHRDVDMDIVQSQISKLQGTLKLDSTQAQGTTVTIKLPLTLAMAQSLLVESAGELFAIPMGSVIESKRINPEEIQVNGNASFIQQYDCTIPVIYLHEALKLDSKNEISWYSKNQYQRDQTRLQYKRLARREDRLYVVIIGSGEQRFGLVVDQILYQQEIAIKSLSPILHTLPYIAGGFISGNGEVVLVLDLEQIESRFISTVRRRAA